MVVEDFATHAEITLAANSLVAALRCTSVERKKLVYLPESVQSPIQTALYKKRFVVLRERAAPLRVVDDRKELAKLVTVCLSGRALGFGHRRQVKGQRRCHGRVKVRYTQEKSCARRITNLVVWEWMTRASSWLDVRRTGVVQLVQQMFIAGGCNIDDLS
jgi:hypothetical protein